jgi:transposase
MRNVALDWGNRISYCEVRDGRVVERRVVSSLEELKPLIGPTTSPARVAIEACREAWFVCDRLQEWGHEPILVDTTRVRALGIGQHGRKNDRIDAEVLARRLEKDDVPRAHLLTLHRRELRRVVAIRHTLVGIRAQIVTAIRGHLRSRGLRVKKSQTNAFQEHFVGAQFDDAVKKELQPLLNLLEAVEPCIAEADQRVDKLSSVEPVVTLLQTAPGVGPIVAASVVCVLDDAKRFKKAHQVESYVGLVPSENTSGKRRLGSITKQGNSHLRALLLQAAWAVLRSREEDPLKQWGKEVQKRRGKTVGAVAVARRLLGILWAMWRDNSAYDAQLLGQQSATGIHREAQAANYRASAIAKAGRKARRRQRWIEKVLQGKQGQAA